MAEPTPSSPPTSTTPTKKTARQTQWGGMASIVVFLFLVGVSSLVVIATLAGTLSRAVELHRGAMYALFIGLTLGGSPLLIRMIGRFNTTTVVGVLAGLGLMIVIAATHESRPDSAALCIWYQNG